MSRAPPPSCEHCYFRGDHAPTVLHTVPLRQLPGDATLLNPEEPGVLGAGMERIGSL